ncbi:MAG TPA: type II toxin-antitoxin system RelE/ParE family toxin, partial [Sunxiuqinia sp.]|nr:type II toxin-antitoxin system RelE/ParE family toxin [Sunxiuqinia sp.]
MRTLLWNKLAQQDYFDIIDYLLKHWSEKEAQHFIDRVSEIEYLLEKGNVDFQNTNRPTIKRCVITKQITLFYRNND